MATVENTEKSIRVKVYNILMLLSVAFAVWSIIFGLLALLGNAFGNAAIEGASSTVSFFASCCVSFFVLAKFAKEDLFT